MKSVEFYPLTTAVWCDDVERGVSDERVKKLQDTFHIYLMYRIIFVKVFFSVAII